MKTHQIGLARARKVCLHSGILGFGAVLFIMGIDGEAHAGAKFTTLDPPGSLDTLVTGLNRKGWVTRYVEDGSAALHGYVRASRGGITVFDPTGSIDTYARSINAKKALAGYYEDDGSAYHGFVRVADGTITTFDAPNGGPPGSTQAYDISSNGAVAGWRRCEDAEIGFERKSDGTFATFDPPKSTYTSALSINSKETVAGYFADNNNLYHGFLRSRRK